MAFLMDLFLIWILVAVIQAANVRNESTNADPDALEEKQDSNPTEHAPRKNQEDPSHHPSPVNEDPSRHSLPPHNAPNKRVNPAHPPSSTMSYPQTSDYQPAGYRPIPAYRHPIFRP